MEEEVRASVKQRYQKSSIVVGYITRESVVHMVANIQEMCAIFLPDLPLSVGFINAQSVAHKIVFSAVV